jgi:cytochrome c
MPEIASCQSVQAQPPTDEAMHRLTAAFVCFLLLATPVAADPQFGTREEAVEMVKRVKEMFEEEGPSATFAAVSDRSVQKFHDRDLYPFIYDLKGVNVAHGARPVLVGKNLSSLKDQNGKYLIQEMIAVVTEKGGGWVDYKWPHPITNKIEDKTSYIERMGDYFVGVGVRP